MSASPATLIALLHGPDQPGLVARVAGWIFERGGNILHADQHRDTQAGVFFQRVEWEPAFANSNPTAPGTAVTTIEPGHAAPLRPDVRPADLATAERDFACFARESLGMSVRILSSLARPRVAVFVSKA